jgi:hypothetical protein
LEALQRSFAELHSNPIAKVFGYNLNLYHHEELRRRIELYNLQAAYNTALSRIGGLDVLNPKRHTPIFQRDAAGSRKQAAKDAASAERTLEGSGIEQS